MSRAFCLVLAELTAGGFATLIFVPPHILGPTFSRFMGILYSACLVGVLYLLSQVMPDAIPTGVLVAFAAPVVAYTVIAWTRRAGLAYLLTWLSLPAAVLFVVWVAIAGGESAAAERAAIAGGAAIVEPAGVLGSGLGGRLGLVGSSIISALLTGSAMTAMLFGHWYLTTPDLPVRYLRRLNGAVIVALGLAAARAGVTGGLLRAGFGDPTALSMPLFGEVYLLARVLFGIVAAGVCVGFTWYCLREDSTQAATGFLYLVVCFSVMGEFISHVLMPQLLLPL
jgi:hypothetical protein